MKLCWITFFISSSILLHSAAAIPGLSGLRYFRSSRDSVNQYRIRDTVPESGKPTEDDSPTINELSNVNNPAGKVANRLKLQRPIDIVQGSLRPEKLRRTNPTNEELSSTITNNKDTNEDQPAIINDDRMPSVAESSPTPQQIPTNDVDIKLPAADVDLPSRQPTYFDNKDENENDGPAFPAYAAEPTMDEDEDQQSQVSPTALSRLRQFASLTSVLANISRIPRAIAIQIDSVMAGLQSTYPTSTNVGGYLMATRFLLRNPMALRPFDLMDRAGLGRVDELVSTMPSVFNPVFNTVAQYFSELFRRMTVVLIRVRDSARTLTDRARNSLSGMNVARSNDSYSFSIPNLIDMVLKGRLASSLDGYFAILQRGLISGLSGIGNTISPSAPIIDPVRRNQGYERRSNPGFSTVRDYLRPIRYYD